MIVFFRIKSHKASMVENQIPRREGHSIFHLHPPPPPSKDDRHPNPWNFAWSLKCCLCPLKKWNLKGSFLVSTFEKFVLLSVGVQILSASFLKRKNPNPHIQKPVISWGEGADTKWNMASLGQTCGDYPIYRQNLGRSAKSKIPDRLGFFPTYKNQALMI